MKDIIVFCGPTIVEGEACHYLKASYFPPAKQGDIYFSCLSKPKIIVLIDGYFENVPAVWHKEILYAMSQGIHVYGCSSMGALRAAELHHFGMKGSGIVYEDFKKGVLEDDDEVAHIHGPAEYEYIAASEPMVNIRATISLACGVRLIMPKDAEEIISIVKSYHYPKRSYQQFMSIVSTVLTPEDYRAFSSFVSTSFVNIKKRDAIELLSKLSNINIGELTSLTVNYSFPHTDAWDELVEEGNRRYYNENMDISVDNILIEAKLKGNFYELKEQAITRKAALREAGKNNALISPKLLQKAMLELSVRQQSVTEGKIDFNRLSEWLSHQSIDLDDFYSLIRSQSLLSWSDSIDSYLDKELVDILKLNGDFESYHRKSKLKSELSIPEQNIESVGLSIPELWEWYFERILKIDLPSDIARYALSCGFSCQEDMKKAVLAEYVYNVRYSCGNTE